jgi:hypothetical protein
MRLVIVPDTDGDSFAIVDEKFPPENSIELTEESIRANYNFDDIITLLVNFNSTEDS